jgi:hypothetical protein
MATGGVLGRARRPARKSSIRASRFHPRP